MSTSSNLYVSKNQLLESILSSSAPAFALLYRPESSESNSVDILTGQVTHLNSLSELANSNRPVRVNAGGYDVLAVVPYRQITERGFECVDDNEPLVAMTIDASSAISKASILEAIQDNEIELRDQHFDADDNAYEETAFKIINDEIGMGAGANFVLKRSFVASITGFCRSKALTLFRRLLQQETGAYWTFIVCTDDRVLVGATPERHVSLKDGIATMNPISGTYRYPVADPTLEGLLEFLKDTKETEELFMVVDEELKMMGKVCTKGASLHGPYLKPMTHLAHTEYMLKGKTELKPWDILRETMFAPTVTGSPLENACRVIKKYEPEGRGYYSGIIALLGRDDVGQHLMDSSILIRTADINKYGTIKISAGSTLVRNSNPASEAAETTAKASALLAALGVVDSTTGMYVNPAKPGATRTLMNHPEVRSLLERRNDHISSFWKASDKDRFRPEKRLAGLRVLVLDAEDTFTSMLCHQLSSLSLSVTVAKAQTAVNFHDYDLFVLGPGPGDPGNMGDLRMSSLQSTVKTLLNEGRLFIAICLSHQILCSYLGLQILRKEIPNQGTQKDIDLFGEKEKVGFYNAYSAISPHSLWEYSPEINIHISRDIDSGEVHALRGPFFSSFQFHPESILTKNGEGILGSAICNLLN